MLDRRFVYVIGSPRSGSTWLQLMLGAHPRVCTTVELTLFNSYLGPWLKVWQKDGAFPTKGGFPRGLPHVWSEAEFVAFLGEFLDRTYRRVAETKPHATHLVDKQPSYSAFTSVIDRFVPGALFVHIIRDGRDVVTSMLAGHRDFGLSTDTVQKAALSWSKHLRHARTAARFGERYIEVRYEDLVADTAGSLTSVLRFCELDADPLLVSEIVTMHEFSGLASKATMQNGAPAPRGFFRKGVVGSWREELTIADRYLLERVAGNLLRELGYAEPGWWAGRNASALGRGAIAAGVLARHVFPRRAAEAAKALAGERLTKRLAARRRKPATDAP